MRKKCILHGGMPKTGSTAIQETFFESSSPDFVYAPLILGNHNFAIEYLFGEDGKDRLESVPARQIPKQFHRKARNLAEHFEAFLQSNTRDVLISSEYLSSLRILDGRDELLKFLRPHFDEIHFIAYVRAPEDYMVSSLQQCMQTSDYLFDLELVSPHYRQRFQPWIDALGAENVTLVAYDPSRFPDGNVVLDFAERLGVRVDSAGNERLNTAQSAEAIAVQQLWNRRLNAGNLSFYQRARISFGRREVLSFGTHEFGIEPGLLQGICQRHQDDIAWAEEQLAQSFTPYTPKPDAVLFKSEEHFSDFAKNAEQSFWSHVAANWSWRRQSLPAIEAFGRTLSREE